MNQAVSSFRSQRWQVALFVLLAALIFMNGYRQNHEFDDVHQVSVSEAKALIDGGALVIDVRESEKFNTRHIPGAINIPLAILQSGIPTSIAHAISQPVVVYCGDGVTTGPEGTRLLNQGGYKQAVNVQPGLQGWVEAGLPVQK